MRRRKSKHVGNGAPREYKPEEVDALTKRANELLDELHDVMGEMATRLRTFLGDETNDLETAQGEGREPGVTGA